MSRDAMPGTESARDDTAPPGWPGPRAREIVERMRAVEGAGPRTGGSEPPLVVERADNATLTDVDGYAFIDLGGSFAVANIGHSHQGVVAAVRGQVGRASHVASAFTSEPRVAFEEALVAIAPAGLDRILLGISGADANDTALKLARSATGRREVVAFTGGYFGRSGAVLGVNAKTATRVRLGRDPEAHFLPFPYRYRWPLGADADVAGQALALLENALSGPASGIGPVAAVLLEPVQGNGGIVVPPGGFLEGVRALCDRHGALLVFDEIQSGFGRTGRLWAAEHWGVVPDLMTVGKGIGGGMAVSAVVGRADLMADWPAGTHTSTFMGNAVNLAAGAAAIEVMRRERLWERAASLGERLRDRLVEDLAECTIVGEVRGLGLFIGIEIVADRAGRAPDAERAGAIRRRAFAGGVLAGVSGHFENVIRICPPLTIEEDALDGAAAVVVEAIRRSA